MRALDQPWPGPFGVGADTLTAGDAWRSPGERTITEGDVDGFAHLSGDHFALHTDPHWAATTRFGARVAHGLLVLSAASGLWHLAREVVVALYGLDHVRFVAPVYIGDTVRVELTVLGVRPRDDEHSLVEAEQHVLEARGAGPVCVARLVVLARRRLATAEGVP